MQSLKNQTLLASALTNEERQQFERQIQIAEILRNKRGLTDDQVKAELQATVALHDQIDATEQLKKAAQERKMANAEGMTVGEWKRAKSGSISLKN